MNAKSEEKARECQKLMEWLRMVQKELDELKKKIREFYHYVNHKINVTSKNSNKPPSADSPYHRSISKK